MWFVVHLMCITLCHMILLHHHPSNLSFYYWKIYENYLIINFFTADEICIKDMRQMWCRQNMSIHMETRFSLMNCKIFSYPFYGILTWLVSSIGSAWGGWAIVWYWKNKSILLEIFCLNSCLKIETFEV